METEAASKRHPPGLYVLFFTEMWERFSYYGMRALLVFYMLKQLHFTQEHSSSIYGLYTGFVYFTPFFGGMLADRVIGQRRAVILGGVLMAIGHFLMAFQPLFYPALLFLILGNGCFKPNLSAQVGGLYPHGDPRRDRAFSIYYVGVNLGAFLSPLVCGTLGERWGWHYGFAAAGVGMVLGLCLYLWGQRYLPQEEATAQQEARAHEPLSSSDKSRIVALVILCAFNILFWAIYEQQGNTLALWADANTDRHIFGWEMPASWVQSFNPAMIFLFTPLVTSLWSRQSRKGREPSSIAKMAIGCILLGLSFLVMIPPARAQGVAGLGWLAACLAILTLGELYLSPVGQSLVSKLSPPHMVSMLMGMWFLSSFFGNYLAGYLGTFWEKMPKESFFVLLALVSFAAGGGILAVLKPLKRAIAHGHPETVDI